MDDTPTRLPQIAFQDYLLIARLYADYAQAVDSGDWDLWPEFFTDDCIYRLIPRENHERGFPLATLFFESKGMLKTGSTASAKPCSTTRTTSAMWWARR